jgi:quercetin dioxygenase-like cupin family protein
MDIRIRPNPALNQLVRSQSVEWQPLDEPGVTGVDVKVLRFDEATNRAPTILLRFAADARYPAHNHPGGEEIYVIEGDITLGRDRLREGDYLYTAPNNVHAVHSQGGCVVLVNVPQAVEVLPTGAARRNAESATRDENPIERRSDMRSIVIAATPLDIFAAMIDSARIARWWGPAGFTNTIHEFDCRPGGTWTLTMHGPDGKDYPNESRFVRVEPGVAWEIEHINGHHFFLAIEFEAAGNDTRVHWRQTFDTVAHYERIAEFVAKANAENLERLAEEVRLG